MKHSVMKLGAAAALAGGMMFAQTQTQTQTPAQPQAQTQAKPRGFRGHPGQRMMQALNLTDTQKQQADAIFKQAREQAQPLRTQLRQNREALNTAAKAGNQGQIQQLSTDQGKLLGQLVAIHAGAQSKFYKILMPDQQAKADQLHNQWRERRRQMHEGRTGME